jgi:polysaccharide biosynthesis transport protein
MKPLAPRSRTWQDYLRILVRRRWAILLVFSVIVATVALQTYTATPIYQATLQMLIERQAPRLLDQQGTGGQYDYSGEEFYQTQYKLLESRALAKKVADKLNLKTNPHYAYIFQNLPSNPANDLLQQAEERLSVAIVAGVQVSPIKQSRLVNISFSHPDPKFAAQMVNTLAQCYNDLALDFNFATSQETAQWLKQKLGEARKKLEESEAKLNEYKRQNNIVALEDKESITAQKLEQLNKDLVSAQTQRMASEAKVKEVSQGNPIPEVLNNSLIQTLKAREAQIIVEISEMSKKFGRLHPRMIQLNNELAATREKIGAEKDHVTLSLKNEYKMAQNQEANLKGALEAQKVNTLDQGDRAIQYRVLLRDVETNRALYENVLKSLKTTTANENVPVTNIRIVQRASVPATPVSPRKSRNLLLATIAGLVLGAAMALGLENLDTTLKTPEEVEEWLGIPNLALVPHMDLSGDNPAQEFPSLVVHHGQQSPASESYRMLRTKIHFSTPGKAPNILLITSSQPTEGKTLTAANLAIAMAKGEGNVLLVDSDLRRPSLHRLFQVSAEPGLTNFLVGEIDDLPAVESPVPHLFLVTSGPIPPNPSELLGSERMREFLTRAQGQFDAIILDSPPILSVADAAILATQSKGVLLVIKAEAVPRKLALEARNHLLEVKASLLGTLLNDVNVNRNGYYYKNYYQYSFHYASKEYLHDKKDLTDPDLSVHPGILPEIKSHLHALKGKFFK